MDDLVNVIALIAERKIAEAMAEGAFDNLPGAGEPLKDDGLSTWPAESRLAMRILKNSGYDEPCDENVFLSAANPASSQDPRRLTKRMTRLQLALDKGAKASGRKKTAEAPQGELDAASEASIIESPYLGKILEKLGGHNGPRS